MSSLLAKKVGRNVLGKQAANYEPPDPYRETYKDHKGRERRRKRKMPEGLSKRDERILRSVRRRAHYLDKGFSLCGLRFGWTAILGLIPGAGDIAQFLLGYMLVLRKCREAEIPVLLQQRMAFNQAVGLGIGLVPLVGDIALAVWKANSRNAALLEDFLIRRAAKEHADSTAGTGSAVGGEDDLAQLALSEGRIDRRTGEKVGGARARERVGGASAGAGGSASPLLDSNVEADAGKKAGRKWYGWGSGGAGTKAEPTTAVAPEGAAGTSAGR
ncbi:hypothetical protein JCM1841_002136 [Sporobolomyces salmonicolor]